MTESCPRPPCATTEAQSHVRVMTEAARRHCGGSESCPSHVRDRSAAPRRPQSHVRGRPAPPRRLRVVSESCPRPPGATVKAQSRVRVMSEAARHHRGGHRVVSELARRHYA